MGQVLEVKNKSFRRVGISQVNAGCTFWYLPLNWYFPLQRSEQESTDWYERLHSKRLYLAAFKREN